MRSAPKLFVTAAIGVVVLGLTGCGATPVTSVGHVEGTVATTGGRNPEVHPAEATVVATPIGGDQTDPYSVTTDGDASFTLDLPPGDYRLSGTLLTPNPGDQLTPEHITVRAGGTSTVELFAIYP